MHTKSLNLKRHGYMLVASAALLFLIGCGADGDDPKPYANNDIATTPQDTAVTINVVANDTGFSDTPYEISIFSEPENGIAEIIAPDSIQYTPDAEFTGADNFDYKITDANGDFANAKVSVTVTATDAAITPSPPIVNLTSNTANVNPSGSITLSWTSLNADSCVASGAWSGTKAFNDHEMIHAINATSTFILGCGNTAGNTSDSVTVKMNMPNENQIRGMVDSHYIDRQINGKVYVYAGTVIPDDIGGNGAEPISVIPVSRNGACTWGYETDTLQPGMYTVAFTNDVDLDNPTTNDDLKFLVTKQINYSPSNRTADLVPSNIVRVGPTRAYKTPSEANTVARDGTVIEIDVGEYVDDVTVWRQNNLTIRAVGGRAHMKATKEIPYNRSDAGNGMGIWVSRGTNTSVENIEFSGAKVPDQNGSGIRAQGNDLTVCNSYFHDNENGILGGGGTVIIEFSEFNHNGLGELGRTHNIYITKSTEKLIFQHNYSHHAYIGHNLKSRAKENYILYNRLMDEMDGRSSYAIDISNGGRTFIIGNLVQQGPRSENSNIISYGAEGLLSDGRVNSLYLVNNTVVNDRGSGTFVDINKSVTGNFTNNIFAGDGALSNGSVVVETTNLKISSPGLISSNTYNYGLLSTSDARNVGTAPGVSDNGFNLLPRYHYVHKARRETRGADAIIDIGAYEYVP